MFIIFLLLCAALIIFAVIKHKIWQASLWAGTKAHAHPLKYLSGPMAVRPSVLKNNVPLGYRLSSLYFGCGLIDRTGTLDHGFPVDILNPLSSVLQHGQIKSSLPGQTGAAVSSISKLCVDRANQILQRARTENRPIRVLWSGGIDSTAAAVALLKTADPKLDRLEFYYSQHSVREYKLFFQQSLAQQKIVKIKSVDQALGTDAIVVTGEHGDQLFGSMKAIGVKWKELNKAWPEALPNELNRRLASTHRVDQVLDYLAPQISTAPISINTFWDALWWMNFSMKWQSVAYRIPAIGAASKTIKYDLNQQFNLTEHFFNSNAFQIWALSNRCNVIEAGNWKTYKWPLRDFIYEYNADQKYKKGKRKQASLNNVIQHPDRFNFRRRCVAIDTAGVLMLQNFDDSLKKAIDGSIEVSAGGAFTISHESQLWSDLGSTGE